MICLHIFFLHLSIFIHLSNWVYRSSYHALDLSAVTSPSIPIGSPCSHLRTQWHNGRSSVLLSQALRPCSFPPVCSGCSSLIMSITFSFGSLIIPSSLFNRLWSPTAAFFRYEDWLFLNSMCLYVRTLGMCRKANLGSLQEPWLSSLLSESPQPLALLMYLQF